jgi:hypothetical protein
MPRFADQIDNRPVLIAPLKVADIQFRRLSSAQSATQQDPEQRPIAFALERIRVRNLPERLCLIGGEPVAQTNTEVLRPLNTPDAGGEILAEQSGIRGLVRKPTDGRKPAINRARRKLT